MPIPMKTRQSLFGHIFGTNLQAFVPGILPTKADVVRHWMHCFDERLVQKDFPPKFDASVNGSILLEVSQDLISVWKAMERPTRPEWDVKPVVRQIVDQVELLKKNSPTKAKESWIQQQRSKFDVECNICYVEPRVITTPKRDCPCSSTSEEEEEEEADAPKSGPSSKKTRMEQALFVPSETESTTSDSDFRDDLSDTEEKTKKFKFNFRYPNAFAALERMNATPREGSDVVCGLLKDLVDLGLLEADPAMFPSTEGYIGMKNELGNELIGKKLSPPFLKDSVEFSPNNYY